MVKKFYKGKNEKYYSEDGAVLSSGTRIVMHEEDKEIHGRVEHDGADYYFYVTRNIKGKLYDGMECEVLEHNKSCDNCIFCIINDNYDKEYDEYNYFFSCGMLDNDFEKHNVKEYICKEYASRPESLTELLERRLEEEY